MCCPLLPPLFSRFIDVCRAEQKLVDSGIAVAPPEHVRDHTASHMPVPLTLAIIHERRSDADDAPTVTVSTVTVPTVTTPTVTVPIEPSGDVDGIETSESSESDSNSDTGEDTGDASDAGDVQASDAGDIQASDACDNQASDSSDDPTSDAGDDKPSGENCIGDSIPGHAGKEPSTSVPFSEHVEACDISSSSVDPLLVSQLSSEHIQGDEISTIAPAVLESSIIPGKLIYFFSQFIQIFMY